MATHSSILALRIPWTEEPDGLQSIESQRVGHDWSDLAVMHISPSIKKVNVLASQVVLVVKTLPANAGNKRCGFDPWDGKIPWRRKWQPAPGFWPGKSHGQKSLVGYSS